MTSDSLGVVERLQRLRRYTGAPREFWSELCAALGEAAGATRTLVLTRTAADDGGAWQALAATGGAAGRVEAITPTHAAAAETAASEGVADRLDAARRVGAVALRTGDANRTCVAVLEFARDLEPSRLLAALRAVQLAADIPESYQTFRQLSQSRTDLLDFSQTLDLLALLRGRTRFLEAAITVCNELAAQHRCTQVALGWLGGRYVRLQALSHREEFEARTDVVQRLEAAMEEALDQEDELLWPPPDALRVTRDLERCAGVLGANHLAVVPLRLGGQPLGALVFQRQDAPIGSDDLRAWRVVADQIAEPLAQLRRRDRWWGARWKTDAEDWLRQHATLEHPWAKLGGALAAGLLLVAFVGQTTHRVEAPFILRPQDQALLGAPFDGYVKAAGVAPGDAVAEGAELFALDDTALRLQEVSLRADVSRYRAEAERARGEGRMAEMRVAQAQEQQASADLELVRHQLASATARAPFAGIVLDDGDLRERLGAPVKRGDLLLKLARADRLYVELNVPERDVDDLRQQARVELAFASRPDLTFAAKVERLEPMAVAKDGGGVFLLRAELTGAPPEWARPGMTGLAKVDAGRRTWFWIATHRLVDWLRLQLWW